MKEESEGNRIKNTTIEYFWNEFNDVIRRETSYDKKPSFIEEVEYTYYEN